MVEKFDDMFSCIDRIPACDWQMDRQADILQHYTYTSIVKSAAVHWPVQMCNNVLQHSVIGRRQLQQQTSDAEQSGCFIRQIWTYNSNTVIISSRHSTRQSVNWECQPLWTHSMTVTFGRLAVIDFDECYCLLIYCVVRFRTLVHFRCGVY